MAVLFFVSFVLRGEKCFHVASQRRSVRKSRCYGSFAERTCPAISYAPVSSRGPLGCFTKNPVNPVNPVINPLPFLASSRDKSSVITLLRPPLCALCDLLLNRLCRAFQSFAPFANFA
jgi:hypothetical protein